MKSKITHYFVAEIAYNPSWIEMPWYIQRNGVVAEQGGFNIGNESISFPTLESALSYLKETINRDMEEVLKLIQEKEKIRNKTNEV